jgi:hypothetical protein
MMMMGPGDALRLLLAADPPAPCAFCCVSRGFQETVLQSANQKEGERKRNIKIYFYTSKCHACIEFTKNVKSLSYPGFSSQDIAVSPA